MTAHQRRPGFRLPWSSEGDTGGETPSAGDAAPGSTDEMGAHAAAESAGSADASEDAPAPENASDQPESATVTATESESAPETAADTGTAAAEAGPPAPDATGEAPSGFLGDLISAMRRVAEEARDATLSDLRSRAEQAAGERQSKADARRDELRGRAENDVAGVGEWAKAEAERIKAEAEQRVAARRAELERQLAAEDSRYETDAEAIRGRVSAYEREVEAFFQQLSDITDPAAFAAAAKRMPPPPALEGSAAQSTLHAVRDPEPGAPETSASEGQAEHAAEASQAGSTDAGEGADASQATGGPAEGTEASSQDTQSTNGSTPANPVANAEGETTPPTALQQVDAGQAAAERETLAEPMATEIVVKGLGSFGAITGFRQQLAGVEGVDAVGLSLGTSGEFVFRATHRPSLDMAAAITALEGEGVEIEPRAEGGLRVTLGRPR